MNKSKIILAIAVTLIILAGGIYFLTLDDSNDTKDDKNTPTTTIQSEVVEEQEATAAEKPVRSNEDIEIQIPEGYSSNARQLNDIYQVNISETNLDQPTAIVQTLPTDVPDLATVAAEFKKNAMGAKSDSVTVTEQELDVAGSPGLMWVYLVKPNKETQITVIGKTDTHIVRIMITGPLDQEAKLTALAKELASNVKA